MKTDLKNTNGVINEIEEILEGVKLGHIQHDEAKIRMWGVKNVIRLMAIEVLRERFIDGTAKEVEAKELSGLPEGTGSPGED